MMLFAATVLFFVSIESVLCVFPDKAGIKAKIKDYKFLVKIIETSTQNHNGVGSLIGAQGAVKTDLVLTAAHVVCNDTAAETLVHLQTAVIGYGYKEKKVIRSKILRAVCHENWTENYEYDIAVIQLQHMIPLNSGLYSVIKFPESENEYLHGIQCSMAGWGAVNYTTANRNTCKSVFPNDLRAMKVERASKAIKHENDTFLTIFMKKNVKVTNGYGDSGAPIVCRNKKKQLIAYGVNKGGPWCDQAMNHDYENWHSTFTNIGRYKSWIQKKISELKRR